MKKFWLSLWMHACYLGEMGEERGELSSLEVKLGLLEWKLSLHHPTSEEWQKGLSSMELLHFIALFIAIRLFAMHSPLGSTMIGSQVAK